MKAKSRKIWSIPIALAMVLMLAGLVGLYGIVQAQSSGNKTFTISGIPGDNYFERTYTRIYGTDEEGALTDRRYYCHLRPC